MASGVSSVVAEGGVVSESKPQIAFVTGNAKKAEEVAAILGSSFPFEVVRMDVDLPELQGTPDHVAADKARVAAQKLRRPVLVEDTSLNFTAWGGNLPGVYIKWFLHDLGT
jgi:inosine triphosphate pyrophosphatase